MIVRIQGEGQYRLSSAALDDLNDIDNKLVDVVASGNDAEFAMMLSQMLDLVRTKGEVLPMEELVESDVVLPPSDITFEDAKDLFVGEGILPG